MYFAGRIANAESARLQPVPFAVGMTNAVFRLVMIRASVKVIARRGAHPGGVIRMNVERSEPRVSGGDGRVLAAAVQQLHFRRHERASLPEIPVEMALVRALQRECVALLTLAQRSFEI